MNAVDDGFGPLEVIIAASLKDGFVPLSCHWCQPRRGSAFGPNRPLMITSNVAVQRHQTGHSCIVQHFRRVKVGRADLSAIGLAARAERERPNTDLRLRGSKLRCDVSNLSSQFCRTRPPTGPESGSVAFAVAPRDFLPRSSMNGYTETDVVGAAIPRPGCASLTTLRCSACVGADA